MLITMDMNIVKAWGEIKNNDVVPFIKRYGNETEEIEEIYLVQVTLIDRKIQKLTNLKKIDKKNTFSYNNILNIEKILKTNSFN